MVEVYFCVETQTLRERERESGTSRAEGVQNEERFVGAFWLRKAAGERSGLRSCVGAAPVWLWVEGEENWPQSRAGVVLRLFAGRSVCVQLSVELLDMLP